MNYSRTLITLLFCLLPAMLSAQNPFGNLDTPANGSTNLAGAINVTGWALSVYTVSYVSIYRAPVPGESGQVFIQYGNFIAGSRPDVAAAYPGYPNNNWGFGTQLLTNELPDSNGDGGRGNGTYTLYAIAVDPYGHSATIGAATISVDNRDSVLPFGTIDSPPEGGTASGMPYVNYGWALAPQPNTIPTNGSTMWVYIDGQPVGNPTYNQYRSDIASLFPGLNNSNGAGGFFYVNTGPLLPTNPYNNGLHTIAWSVTDSVGHVQGIGSRWFNVGPIATLTNTSNSAASPNFAAGDSYTLTVSAGVFRANQTVSVTATLNGVGQGTTNMGTTDANGNFTTSGTKNSLGNWTEQWFVGVVGAPSLTYAVIAKPPGYDASNTFASIPGSFTAPTPTVLCNNIAGTWNSADGYNNSVEWTLNQSGNSVSGMLSFEAYLNTTDCGPVTYSSVTGSYGGTGTTFSLTASNPSPTTACGYAVASSFADTVSLSGSSCSAASGSFSSPLWPVGISTALPHGSLAAQQPRQRSGTDSWMSMTPRYNVQYAAYIPVDHVPGTPICSYNLIPRFLLYMGDAYRGTFRTSQSLLVTPDTQTSGSFQANVGQTRNYGYGSPANGSTLSSADEDGIPNDCYLWNNAGTANTNNMQYYGVSYPTGTQAQITLDGAGSNPLTPSPPIEWNMTVTINDSTPSQPTAIVNYSHTCYPAHQVKVNGTVVYSYQPPRNDMAYIGGCLGLPAVNGATGAVPVPAH